MKFTPKDLTENNINVTKENPVKEVLKLLFVIFIIISITYYILGLAANHYVEKIPKEVENYLASILTETYTSNEDSTTPSDKTDKEELKIQKLLNNLILNMEDNSGKYNIHISENEMVNAMALPGNNIIIFSGLLDEIETENELSMILAHELGHFANRDHLRGLGRGLVLITLSIILMGADSSINEFIANIALTTTESRFSQKQE